jgi:hypothetical protein
MSNPRYIPGVCNIGPAEIRARRSTGILGLATTIIFLVIFLLFNIPPVWRLIIFIPAAGAAVGFLQAQLHFCVHFGMSGLFNVGDDLAKHETVDQAEYRKKDQQKAVTIMVVSAALGLIVTLLSLYI